MKLKNVSIKNFKSIDRVIHLKVDNITLLAGANSTGKSNILKAIEYAVYGPNTFEEIYENLPVSKRDRQGRLATEISLEFSEIPNDIRDEYELSSTEALVYKFKVNKGSHSISRTVNGKNCDLSKLISVIYVPAIRDISTEGLTPFKKVFSEVVRKGRGNNNINTALDSTRDLLAQRAPAVLNYHQGLVNHVFHADNIVVDPSQINFDNIYSDIQLTIVKDSFNLPLSSIGTGHQSALVMSFYRQIGENEDSNTIFLFEEPDNHMHPSAIRQIGEDIEAISEHSQVLVTTHSPILVDHFGLSKFTRVSNENNGNTSLSPSGLTSQDARILRDAIASFGLKATEPIFSKHILVLEGITDVLPIARYIEYKCGTSPHNMGLTIIPVGGKGKSINLCKLLEKVGLSWSAIVDKDAIYGGNPSCLKTCSDEELDQSLQSIEQLREQLDEKSPKYTSLNKQLDNLENELKNGATGLTTYSESVVERLVGIKGSLSPHDKAELIERVDKKQVRKPREILNPLGIWYWNSGAIEEVLINKNETKIKNYLSDNGYLTNRTNQNLEKRHLAKLIKKLLRSPENSSAFMDFSCRENILHNSEIKQAYEAIIEPFLRD